MKITKFLLSLVLLLPVLFVGCDLDIDNPNSPTGEAIESYDGLALLAVGMQGRLSQSIAQMVTVVGAVTGETSPVIGYLDYQSLRKYTNNSDRVRLEKDNTYVRLIWREQYRIVKAADDIVAGATSVELGAGTRSSLIALANTGKVMALYNVLTCWEELPVSTESDLPEFYSRDEVVNICLSLLDDAEAEINANGIPADFRADILAEGFDLQNLIKAYRARLLLIKGEYGAAAAAANAVTAEAEYVYSTGVNFNPLYTHFTEALFTKALAYWANDAEPGDLRIPETVDTTDGETRFGQDSVYTIIEYSNPATPYQIYTMNEMRLIKAECYARAGGGDAEAEVNAVRSEAGLPAFDGSTSILEEVFKQRFYDLYLTAQLWEVYRRFDSDNIAFVENMIDEHLAHWWLVYPDWEIDKNPNTPPQQTKINLGL